MREDVPPFQQRQQIRLVRPVHHDRQARLIGYRSRPLQHFEVIVQLAVVAVDADLDREDPILVLVDDANGGLGIDQPEAEIQLVPEIPDRRDVQHRVDAKRRRVDDVFAKTEEGTGAAGPRVDRRRDAGGESDGIGIDGNGIRVPVQVRVRVDQPGGHELSGGVEHVASPVGRNVRRDGGNLSARDGDIELAVQFLRGVDDAAALDQQVVGSGRLACGRRRGREIGTHANRVRAEFRKGKRGGPERAKKRAATERDMSGLHYGAARIQRGPRKYLANRLSARDDVILARPDVPLRIECSHQKSKFALIFAKRAR